MKKLYTIIYFQCFIAILFGQDIPKYDSKFHVRLNSGYNFLLSDHTIGTETDNLIGLPNSYFYIEPSFSYFFLDNLGAEFSFQFSGLNRSDERLRDFKNETEPLYSDDYHYSAIINGDNVENIFRWNLGLLYRYETNRFFIIPKLSVGATSFSANAANINLKEINSNNELNIEYIPNTNETESYNFFTLGASSYVGYKLLKKLYLNLNISSYYFNPKFSIEKRTTDLTTGEIIASENIMYNKSIINLGIGLGAAYVF